MAEEKKLKGRKQEKWHSEYYYRYIDLRAIIPAMLIALVWGLAISFYIPSSAITQIIAEQTTHAVHFPVLTGWIVDIIFRGIVFVFDFIIVFLIFYFIFWVVWKEQDKRLILKPKKKIKL